MRVTHVTGHPPHGARRRRRSSTARSHPHRRTWAHSGHCSSRGQHLRHIGHRPLRPILSASPLTVSTALTSPCPPVLVQSSAFSPSPPLLLARSAPNRRDPIATPTAHRNSPGEAGRGWGKGRSTEDSRDDAARTVRDRPRNRRGRRALLLHLLRRGTWRVRVRVVARIMVVRVGTTTRVDRGERCQGQAPTCMSTAMRSVSLGVCS